MDKVYFGTPGSFFVSRVVVSKVVTMISPELSQNPLEDPSGILIECVSLLQILHKSTNSKQKKHKQRKFTFAGIDGLVGGQLPKILFFYFVSTAPLLQ